MLSDEELYKMADCFDNDDKIENVKTCCDDAGNHCTDNNNYYKVCNKCGSCLNTIRHEIISYNELSRIQFTKKRCYSQKSYFETKLDKIFRSKLKPMPEAEIQIMINEYVKNLTIENIRKYIKKYHNNKYDPTMTYILSNGLNKNDIQISSELVSNMSREFINMVYIYKQRGIKRISYNYIISVILNNHGQSNLIKYIVSLQDRKRLKEHIRIYTEIFN